LIIGGVLAATVAACGGPDGPLAGRASDEWTHHYPLTQAGEIRISNTNGLIEVDAVDPAGPGNTGNPGNNDVEVRAERIALALTDAAATDLLPRIVIREDIKPDAVSIETEKMAGIMFGASTEIRYHVKAPKNATIHVSTTN